MSYQHQTEKTGESAIGELTRFEMPQQSEASARQLLRTLLSTRVMMPVR